MQEAATREETTRRSATAHPLNTRKFNNTVGDLVGMAPKARATSRFLGDEPSNPRFSAAFSPASPLPLHCVGQE